MPQTVITVIAAVVAAACVALQLRGLVRLCRLKKQNECRDRRVIVLLLMRVSALEAELASMKKEFMLDKKIYVGKETHK